MHRYHGVSIEGLVGYVLRALGLETAQIFLLNNDEHIAHRVGWAYPKCSLLAYEPESNSR